LQTSQAVLARVIENNYNNLIAAEKSYG
jgi:hypothetical protein